MSYILWLNLRGSQAIRGHVNVSIRIHTKCSLNFSFYWHQQTVWAIILALPWFSLIINLDPVKGAQGTDSTLHSWVTGHEQALGPIRASVTNTVAPGCRFKECDHCLLSGGGHLSSILVRSSLTLIDVFARFVIPMFAPFCLHMIFP